MTESIFRRIYSYRESENKGAKENFLIEIFAFCLNTDKRFLNDFLFEIGLVSDDKTKIKTQSAYKYGRPDLEINITSTDTCILIECKVEHFERENQLEDYKKILLEKKVKNRHLVYLTKYYEHRTNDLTSVEFKPLRWSDIYRIIDDNNSQITNELKTYLKNENMEDNKNFNYTDLSVLNTITSTLSKMDEVLDGIRDFYKSQIGPMAIKSSWNSRLQEKYYASYKEFGANPENYKFSISIGYFWMWEDGEVWLGIRIKIPTADNYKNSHKYIPLIEQNLTDWELEDSTAYVTGKYQKVASFIVDEEEQIPAMVDYLKECIKQLNGLKKIDPTIFD